MFRRLNAAILASWTSRRCLVFASSASRNVEVPWAWFSRSRRLPSMNTSATRFAVRATFTGSRPTK